MQLVSPYPSKNLNIMAKYGGIEKLAKRPRLDLPVISADNVGKIMTFAGFSFKKAFKVISGKEYTPGESMMPRNSDSLSVLRYHDAKKDDNFALRNWFDLEPSGEKLEQLKILLDNPTVHFFIDKMYVLEQASQLGDLQIIQKLLEKGLLPNSKAVIQASKYGHDHIVKFFWEYPDLIKDRLLEFAIDNGDLKLVNAIIEDQNLRGDLDEVDLLANACDQGSLEVVKFLYEEKGFRFSQDFVDEFLIGSTIGGGNVEVLKYFLDTINIWDVSDADIRWEILDEAAGIENANILRFLFQDERFNLEASRTTDFIIEAINWTNLDIFKFLTIERNITLPESFDPLLIARTFDTACFVGELEFVKYFANKYPYLRDRKNSAWLALKYAVHSGNSPMIEYLFSNFDLQDKTLDFKEIIRIEKNGHGLKSLQEYFKSISFLFDKLGIHGNIELMNLAISNQNTNLARYLLHERNVVPNQESIDLSISSTNLNNQDFSLVNYLVEKYNLLPNPETLNWLVFINSLSQYDYLLRKGMKPQIRDLNTAIFLRQDAFINYFLEKEMVPIKTSLDIASFQGNLKLVRLFCEDFGIMPDEITFEAAAVDFGIKSPEHPEVIRYLQSLADYSPADQESMEGRFYSLLNSDFFHQLLVNAATLAKVQYGWAES